MKKLFLKNRVKNSLSEKSRIFVWTLFDFANTSYSIIVVTFIFAVYFKETIASGESIGDFYWSLGISVSMIITALISPVLGAIADYSTGKKRFLLFFTLVCIISTSLLYFTVAGGFFLAIFLFILANIGFEAGLVFYDAFLPELTQPKNYGRVSGYGYAMGYIGSLATLAIIFPFIQSEMIKETLPVAAAFFLIFSLPLFFLLSDTRRKVERSESYASIGFNRVLTTIKNLPKYKNLATFLLAFFFYIEGVNTVIFFSGNYARTTLGMSFQELIVFFIIVQTTAIVGSIIFGILADSIGQKKSIVLSLWIWIFTIITAFVTSDPDNFLMIYLNELFGTDPKTLQIDSFYFVGLLAGSVMGATQSTSRSLMSNLTPDEKKTEFFGFFSFFGKSSAIMGPLVFGLISFSFDSQRIAILSIGMFFIIGLSILKFVKDENPEVIN
ncbi:MAG: MFS transporter [Melioribacteraceae bacterium]|nr:MFS transporter [Melioribacteraceae bacterium]MCF8353943.1 MFS transporter [Melioribacteraceae bacterium]MCF8393671.1 MFS transporter [Melioribacteraceae bacterium]MCF8419587.1 MFS transporter [Melioribacteraceae bacterium]